MECIRLNTKVTELFYFPEIKYLHLFLKADVEYSLENVESDFKTIHELKKDDNIFVLIDMTEASFEHIPKETLHYMANSPYKKYQKKIAIITKELGTKLLGNFYLKYFKPEAKTRLFTKSEEALLWFGIPQNKFPQIEQALQHNR